MKIIMTGKRFKEILAENDISLSEEPDLRNLTEKELLGLIKIIKRTDDRSIRYDKREILRNS